VPAVWCSKCGADLPDGSQFCQKCGEPVQSASVSGDFVVTTATLGCSGCGAKLAEGALFCSRCGKGVSTAREKKKISSHSAPLYDSTPSGPTPAAASSGHKRRVIPWVMALGILLVLFWAATSDNFLAQGMQEFAGWRHDQGIVDSPFSIGAHTFRYYKFALPQGSMHVSIVGEFNASSDPKPASSQSGEQSDNNVEVYVMSESAFVVWQNGYATSNVYESGRVSHGALQADLPSGAGIYYLIFSNKFAPRTAKQVNADVMLRYKNWVPESFRRMSERFWNWIGL
jgi:ribosomal protein L40E